MYARVRKIVILLFASVVFGAGGLCWYALARYTDPEVIRNLVIGFAREKLPGAKIDLASVEPRLFGDSRLREIVVETSTEGGGRRPIIRLPEVTLTLDTDWLRRNSLRPHIRKAVLERAELHLHREMDGTWNVSPWIGLHEPQFSGSTTVEIRDATLLVTFADPALPSIRLDAIDIDAELTQPANIEFHLACRHEVAASIQVDGKIELATKLLQVEARTGSPIDLALLRGLIRSFEPAKLAPLRELVGSLDLRLVGAAQVTETGVDWEGSLEGRLSDVSFTHPSFPNPVRNVEGSFTASPKGLDVPSLKMRIGAVRADLAGTLLGWGDPSIVGHGAIRDITFSDRIRSLAPKRHQQTWDKFKPQGSFDLKGTVGYENGKLRMTGAAQLRDVACSYYKFAYPVDRINGRAELHDDGHVSIKGNGVVGGRRVEGAGTISDLHRGSAIDLRFTGTGVPLDEALMQALPASAEKIARKFDGVGTADVTVRVTRPRSKTGNRNVKPQVAVDADLHLQRVLCEWFPYELFDVTGHLSYRPEKTLFTGFTGTSDGATIEVDGQTLKTTIGTYVNVAVRGENVKLDEKLRRAIPVANRVAWEALDPRGRVAFGCRVIDRPDTPLDIALNIDPTHASVRPVAFPYRLDGSGGQVGYEGGMTTWRDLEVRHGAALWTSSGNVVLSADGGVLTLNDVVCDRLAFDEDLRLAAPVELTSVLDFLSPNRPVEIDFKEFAVRWWNDNARPIKVSYDGAVSFVDAALVPDVGAENVTGKVTFAGVTQGEKLDLRGNIELKSISIANFRARNLTARLTARGDEVNASNIKGDFYGGVLSGKVLGNVGLRPAYECELFVSDASLKQYVRETVREPPDIDGVVGAQLFLSGSGAEIDRLDGKGLLTIRDADVYRVPILLDIFKLIKFQTPDGKVFDDVTCMFSFRDNTMLIDHLELLGPSLSLKNEPGGRMDLTNYALDLAMSPRGFKRRLKIPLISPLVNTATDQLLTIQVRGTLTDRKLILEPVPCFRRLFEGSWRLFNPPADEDSSRSRFDPSRPAP